MAESKKSTIKCFFLKIPFSNLCKKYEVERPAYDYENMFELNVLPHQRYLLLK